MSNVTGENLDLLKMFMNLLSSRTPNTDDKPAEFQIDDTYSVPGNILLKRRVEPMHINYGGGGIIH